MRLLPSLSLALLGVAFQSSGCTSGTEEPMVPWDWCPGTETYLSFDSGLTLEVTDRAVYCSIPQSPVEGPAALFPTLSKIMLIEGLYQTSDQTGTYPLRLPMCVQFTRDGEQPLLGDVGEIQVDHRHESWGDSLRAWYHQPMDGPDQATWEATANITMSYEGELPPVILDGNHDPLAGGGEAFVRFELSDELEPWPRSFYGCGAQADPDRRVEVHFDGGSVVFDLEIVSIVIAGAVPIGFLRRAAGRLDGADFVQSGYFDLIYIGGHHGWENDYYVRFTEPIGEACGMWVSDQRCCDPDDVAWIRLLDCDLEVYQERQFESLSYQ